MTETVGRWVTMNGRRVFIPEGEAPKIPAYFKAKRSRAKFDKHVIKNGEFGDITLEQYVQKASALSLKTEGVEELKLTDGRHYKYDPSNNEFLLVENNRVTTFFKPKLGEKYWKLKKEEYKELVK